MARLEQQEIWESCEFSSIVRAKPQQLSIAESAEASAMYSWQEFFSNLKENEANTTASAVNIDTIFVHKLGFM